MEKNKYVKPEIKVIDFILNGAIAQNMSAVDLLVPTGTSTQTTYLLGDETGYGTDYDWQDDF